MTDKIIELNRFKTEHHLYDDEAKEILKGMPSEYRDRIREAMECSTRKYIEELSRPIDIQISGHSSEIQKESIRLEIKRHQDICKALIQDLAIANAKLALNDCKNS